MSANSTEPQEVRLEWRVWHWLGEVQRQLRKSRWQKVLNLEGLDILDALVVPLYHQALALARAERGEAPVPNPSLSGRLALRLKQRRLPGPWRHWQARFRSRTATQSARVVFWPRLGNHVEVQAPVYRTLLSRGIACLCLTEYPRTFEEARRQGLEPLFAPRVWRHRLRRARRRILERVGELVQDPCVSLPPLPGNVDTDPIPHFRDTLHRQIPFVSDTQAIARAVLEELRSEILVVGYDLTLEGRSAARQAQTSGITTACLMHGLLGRDPLHSVHIVDRFLLYGERSRRQLLDLGTSPGRLAVCGNPSLDPVPQQRHRLDPRLHRLGVRAGRPYLLIATSGPGHSISLGHHRRLVTVLTSLPVAIPEAHFVVKLHPKDHRDHYRDTSLTLVEHGTPGLPKAIFSWLQGCRGVITGASTVAVEAMLLEVPVITVDLAGELSEVDFIREGVTLHATDTESLEAAVEAVLGALPEAREAVRKGRQFAAETFEQPPEGAAERAADKVLELLSREEV